MKKGEQEAFTAHGHSFVLTRLHRCYHLRDLAVKERSRFADTLKEIMADVAYAKETGHLPPPSGPRW